jgi:histidine ammonia-lyase
MGAAVKLRKAVRNVETVLGIELLVAAQGLEFRKPLRAGRGVDRAYTLLRDRVPPLDQDRFLAPDIEAATALVREGVLANLWRV